MFDDLDVDAARSREAVAGAAKQLLLRELHHRPWRCPCLSQPEFPDCSGDRAALPAVTAPLFLSPHPQLSPSPHYFLSCAASPRSVSAVVIMPEFVDPRMTSIKPRIRYNTIGGVNGPLVILDNVRHLYMAHVYLQLSH